MDNNVYLGELERRKQGKFKTRFCEARSNTRSDTTHLPQVAFFTFCTQETDAQKDEVIYKLIHHLGKE